MSSAKRATTGAPTTISSIPLTDAHPVDGSIGNLVKDAATQVSTLVRSEIALAKIELFGEIKKVIVASVFFITAAVVLLFSTFYFFFFLAELFAEWFDSRWMGYGLVFLIMLIVGLILLVLGAWRVYRQVKKPPTKTIKSLQKLPEVIPTFGDTEPSTGRAAP